MVRRAVAWAATLAPFASGAKPWFGKPYCAAKKSDGPCVSRLRDACASDGWWHDPLNDLDHGDVCRKGDLIKRPGDCRPVPRRRTASTVTAGPAGRPCGRRGTRPARRAATKTGRRSRGRAARRHRRPRSSSWRTALDLGWLDGFAEALRACAVDVREVYVYSKCGRAPVGAPNGSIATTLPNVGRCDHAYAHHVRRRRKRLRRLVFFLKDSSLHGSRADFRHLSVPACDMARAAARERAGLRLRPRPTSAAAYHDTEVLLDFGHVAEHHHAWEQRGATNATAPYFKHANVRAFLDAEPAVEAALRLGPVAPCVAPVCYGGTFAAARDRILDVPEKAWAALERALTRGDNIEEGSFVERLWAPLLAARPSADVATAVACAAARTVRPPRSYAGMLRRCDCKRSC
ncbi:hypothetical protein JL722_13214 [Aureococcus anophagefferens]|nr:hypothetical protein JL722_13214 [Aureococcus anophagefferens]